MMPKSLLELADEANDEESREEAHQSLKDAGKALDELELESLFFDDYDEADAILSVHAGAGGVDAQGLGRDDGAYVSALPHRLRLRRDGRGDHRRATRPGSSRQPSL